MMPPASALLPWLQDRLAGHVPARRGDHPDLYVHKAAAVLIGLVLRAEGPTILLTERAAHLPHHAGQISFPGGRVEADDADVIAAALRESWEEVGLPAQHVQVAGLLGRYATVSGYDVTPVVACIDPHALQLRADPAEVAAVFELPAAALLDPARYERRWVERRGMRGRSHFIECEGKTVWGATAGMLLMLAAALGLPGEPRDID
ncbi:8-oxo-dGTP pyrophosphatase MutT, NUDIX family [Andreprevotia lacus DSM 23236]|jgi:8-oxo-dGTP pyrophosphatase MutT (NUDIX family)|uniref:8-oxo-dGTP pyrophosphatase MutT, NUDIX family n=1 Tax=Andreprevotia lacus DSM 23236 TaxID=1121001 RepID=A0A1W1XYB8_9NEIS|nr:CoA pyrophosphatase [Andreprevotia lacus]SMC28906.1 8-oxo-dGTP pyrophosphatase MutT, NUDIX family [Andreprevotia lacus DSM 23236]